jgi:hypothetical protein
VEATPDPDILKVIVTVFAERELSTELTEFFGYIARK